MESGDDTAPMLIDTDTASDDAVALMMALRHPGVEVVAITVVAGNVSTELGSRNARFVVELCEREVPVYEGARAPLLRPPFSATFFHGEDGMGDTGYAPPRTAPARGQAADAIVAAARSRPGLTVVTLGPLTNLALAIAGAPDIVSKIGRCVVMGGACCTVGNVTPAAEYNIWCDPEAAQMCLRSGLPIELVGWELCRGDANLSPEDVRFVEDTIRTPWARVAIDCNRSALRANRQMLGDPGIPLPDPVAMAIAIDPSVCARRSRHYVQVECASELTRGMTVVDQLGVAAMPANAVAWRDALAAGEPNVNVCWEIDVRRWKDLLFRLLG